MSSQASTPEENTLLSDDEEPVGRRRYGRVRISKSQKSTMLFDSSSKQDRNRQNPAPGSTELSSDDEQTTKEPLTSPVENPVRNSLNLFSVGMSTRSTREREEEAYDEATSNNRKNANQWRSVTQKRTATSDSYLSSWKRPRLGEIGISDAITELRDSSEDLNPEDNQEGGSGAESIEARKMREARRNFNKRMKEKSSNANETKELIDLITNLEDRILIVDNGNGASTEHSGPEDEFDTAEKQKQQLEESIKSLSLMRKKRARINDDGENWAEASKDLYIVKGMVTPLMDHQLIAVNWMANVREKGAHRARKPPHGGLLFDAMGLGKTMQCIATMCQNPPPDDEKEHRMTLVVCPVGLLKQWKDEIEQHTERGKFSVYIHHGNNRSNSPRHLQSHQVVITTYDIVKNDYPTIDVPPNWENLPRIDEYINREYHRLRGVLLRLKYWRVIFDESHFIRNKGTHRAEAAMALADSAKQCWCLTGTPISNGLPDLFTAFNIIKMPYLKNEVRFNKIIEETTHPEKAIQVSLRVAMLRRTKEDTLLGKPLITLPPKEIRPLMVKLDPDARALYEVLEGKLRKQINTILETGKLAQRVRSIHIWLLRLKQVCSHPYLAADELKRWSRVLIRECIHLCNTYYSIDHGEKALLESESTSTYGFPLVEFELLESEKLFDDELSEAEACRIRMQDALERRISSQTSYRTRPLLDYLYRLHYGGYSEDHAGEEEEVDLIRFRSCLYCENELNFAVITSCGHIYCRDCIESAILRSGDSYYQCVACNKPIEGEHLKDTDDIQLEEGPREGKDTDEERAKAERKKRQDMINAEFKENIKSHFYMTTKLLEFQRQVREWRKDRPGQKIVLFSLAAKFLDIIQKVTDKEGWKTTRYQGNMSIAQREKSLVTFKTDPNCLILLTSTKAGGVGLNLTEANLVISMDLWWNAAVELQAFDRVHRLGQKRDVVVGRCITEKTVETRILELQEKKILSANMALGEGGELKITKLSHEELLSLFGVVTKNKEGQLVGIGRD